MLPIPTLDDRSYQQLLDEALARIPVHNPEWTNFNKSDPGVTLLELFAFMQESLLYRANLIPERNRRKFLSLLGVGQQPGASARGLVAIHNEKGPLQSTLLRELEVRAGSVPFRTSRALEVLPIEARVYYKQPKAVDAQTQAALEELFASFFPNASTGNLNPYQTTLLGGAVKLGDETVDNSLWVALLLRKADRPAANPPSADSWDRMRQQVAEVLAGKVLSLGIVPDLSEAQRNIPVDRGAAVQSLLEFSLPRLEVNPTGVSVAYEPLSSSLPQEVDVLNEPGVIELLLPAADKLHLRAIHQLEPLEAGVGDLPPALEDTQEGERLLTWLRIRPPQAARARIAWMGINAVMVRQESWVRGEPLPQGTGEPDQSLTLSQTPVLPQTLQLFVTPPNEPAQIWEQLPGQDLMSADPEVPVPDLRQPPGSQQSHLPRTLRNQVYVLDPATAQVRFGDGFHGKRPPLGSVLRADYAYGLGAAGNVGLGQISSGPELPAGFKVSNPVRTWGGAAAQTVEQAEKTIPRYLQHRDRLVNGADFETLVYQTPGVEVGRVEVLPAYSAEFAKPSIGDAPGAVTLMLIPKTDPTQPDAPLPDQLFMQAVCRHLEPRRLITTELFLRPPSYKPIWFSVGIEVMGGFAFSAVREAVKQALYRFFSPLPRSRVLRCPEDSFDALQSELLSLNHPQELLRRKGWPLGKPVLGLELVAEVSRVAGVKLVNGWWLGQSNSGSQPEIKMERLELPRLLGLSVSQGDPVALEALRGDQPETTRPLLPVPFVPPGCD